MSISFVIPGTPVAKGRPKFSTAGGFARAYTPAKTANYEGMVSMLASQAMREAGIDKPLDGPVSVAVHVFVGVPASYSKKRRTDALNGMIAPTKRPDLDNIAKAILDGINGVAVVDDSQIVGIIAGKAFSETPRVDVTVSVLSHMEAAK